MRLLVLRLTINQRPDLGRRSRLEGDFDQALICVILVSFETPSDSAAMEVPVTAAELPRISPVECNS